MSIIKDGTGTGNAVKIDSSNRLHTVAVSTPRNHQAVDSGKAFNINTGIITLTSASKSAVLYFKNTGTQNISIPTLFYLIGNSTGGSGDALVTVLRNPTAGTIVSGATNVEINANRNFGSATSLNSDAFKGTEATTFTDGTKVIESIFNQSAARAALDIGTIVLKPGNSIGIDFTPATGNTALNIEIAFECFIED